MQRILWALTALTLIGCAHRASVPDERGIGIFTKPDDFDDAKISPDGTRIAISSFDGTESRVEFMQTSDLKVLGGSALRPPLVLWSMEWASNDRLVMELGQRYGPLDLVARTGEIMAVDVDGSNPKLVFSFRQTTEMQTGSHIKKAEAVRAFGTILDPLPNDPGKILVFSRRWSDNARGTNQSEVVAVDVQTGVHRSVLAGPGDVDTYFTDGAGDVRVALSEGSDGDYHAFLLTNAKDGWQPLDTAALSPGIQIEGWSSVKREIYLVEEDDEGPGLFALSLDGGQRLLSRHAGSAPREILFDPETGAPAAVDYEPDYPVWDILDETRPITRVLGVLKEKYPQYHARVTSMSTDGKVALAKVYSDRLPGVFHLVVGDDAKALFSIREGVDVTAMSPMEAFKITASDGVELHGYLTTPAGKSDKMLPMVVIPHGGPTNLYDEWRFDPEVQMFAKFGFAVLQLNYRGSGGYGMKLTRAGDLHWGDRIQDDIIEAVRWAIGEGVADPARIAIYGASFGGYSALESAIRAPKLFRCAVAYAGVYDLAGLFQEGDLQESEFGVAYLKRQLGDDAAALAAVSPIHGVDRIQVPVLLIHGEADERAPFSQAEAIAKALQAQKKPVETLFVPDEGHGFRDPGNNLMAHQRALEFIERYTH